MGFATYKLSNLHLLFPISEAKTRAKTLPHASPVLARRLEPVRAEGIETPESVSDQFFRHQIVTAFDWDVEAKRAKELQARRRKERNMLCTMIRLACGNSFKVQNLIYLFVIDEACSIASAVTSYSQF